MEIDIEFMEKSFERGRCIYVPATLQHHTKTKAGSAYDLFAILDTGATTTHISKHLLFDMGYSEKDFTQDTKTSLSVTGEYKATLCKVRRFIFCGLSLTNLTVKVWELPKGHHVDGIIGMDLIRHYNLHINSDTQKVTIHRSHATNKALQKP